MNDDDNVKRKEMMCKYFETFRERIETGMPFQLREGSTGLNNPWIIVDGHDIRLSPGKGRYFLEINTYPNDPMEALKMINHITYGPALKKCYLNEKGKEAFFPADTKDDDAEGQINTV
jgi:hypothetical protein